MFCRPSALTPTELRGSASACQVFRCLCETLAVSPSSHDLDKRLFKRSRPLATALRDVHGSKHAALLRQTADVYTTSVTTAFAFSAPDVSAESKQRSLRLSKLTIFVNTVYLEGWKRGRLRRGLLSQRSPTGAAHKTTTHGSFTAFASSADKEALVAMQPGTEKSSQSS